MSRLTLERWIAKHTFVLLSVSILLTLSTKAACDNPDSAQSQISFNHDSASVKFSSTGAATNLTSWEDHLQDGCYEHQTCWLSGQGGWFSDRSCDGNDLTCSEVSLSNAQQSSTMSGLGASNPITGNGAQHTNQGVGQWWQADFPSELAITEIQVQNRVDCCGDRMANYEVYVGTNLVGQFPTLTQDGVWYTFTSLLPVTGSFVKLLTVTNTFIHFNDIRVFTSNGCYNGIYNLGFSDNSSLCEKQCPDSTADWTCITPAQDISIILDINQAYSIQMSTLFEFTEANSQVAQCQQSYTLSSSDQGFSISGSYLDFDTSIASISRNSSLLTVTDHIANQAFLNITYFVCGQETINLSSNAPSEYVLTYIFNSGSQKVEVLEFEDYFESSEVNCTVANYRLVQINSRGEAELYEGAGIQIDTNFTIEVDTSVAMDADLYIEASSKNSNDTALLNFKVQVYVKNFPPYFKDGLPEHQVIEYSQGGEFTYDLPEIVDQEDLDQSQITATVSNLDQTFMQYNETNKSLNFFGLTSEIAGNYSIKVDLTDSLGLSSTQTLSFEFTFIGIDQLEGEALTTNETDNLTQQNTGSGYQFKGFLIPEAEEEMEEKAKTPLTADISEMTYTGQVILEFNTPLKDVPLSEIDETQVSLDLKIMDFRNFDEGFNLTNLEFQYELVYQKGTTLIIQITFEKPHMISPTLNLLDHLLVSFKKQGRDSIFKAESDNYTSLETKEVLIEVQKQIENSQAVLSFQSGTEIAKVALIWCLIVSFIMNVVLNGAAKFITQMLRYLQIVVHLQMMNISMPANIMLSNSILIQVAQFDVFSGKGICSKCEINQYFQFDTKRDAQISEQIPAQIRGLAYTSYQRMDNMGSLSLVFILYSLQVILVGVIMVQLKMTYLKRNKRVKQPVQKLLKWLIKETFYNSALAVATESYFEFIIGGYLHLHYSQGLNSYGITRRGLEESIDKKFDNQYENLAGKTEWESPLKLQHGPFIGYGFSVVTLLIFLVIIPIVAFWLIFQDQNSLNSVYKDSIGSLYAEIRTRNKKQRSYPFAYLLRRILIVYVLLQFQQEYQGIQLLLLQFLNLFAMMYIGSYRRLLDQTQHRLDIWNECCLSLLHILLVLYTEWTPIELRNQYGWLFVAVNSCMLLVNIAVVIYQGIKGLFLVVKKNYRICKNKVFQKNVNDPGLSEQVQAAEPARIIYEVKVPDQNGFNMFKQDQAIVEQIVAETTKKVTLGLHSKSKPIRLSLDLPEIPEEESQIVDEDESE